MIGVTLFGYGQMGHQIVDIINAREDMGMYQIYDFGELLEEFEDVYDQYVVIDFSHFKMHDMAIGYALEKGCPIVCGTTGLSDEQIANLKETACKEIPVTYNTNYSYGVVVLKRVLAEAMKHLADWDIELLEAHHNKKQDAPSGTAKTLLGIIGDQQKVYGREGICPRQPGEVGVHAIRGGTEAGLHQIQFWGDNEMIEIKHHAQSRRIFANGAVMAAAAISKVEKGFYTFEELC